MRVFQRIATGLAMQTNFVECDYGGERLPRNGVVRCVVVVVSKSWNAAGAVLPQAGVYCTHPRSAVAPAFIPSPLFIS